MKTNFLLHIWILERIFRDFLLVKIRQRTFWKSYVCLVLIRFYIQCLHQSLSIASPFLNFLLLCIALFAWFHCSVSSLGRICEQCYLSVCTFEEMLPLHSQESFGLSQFCPGTWRGCITVSGFEGFCGGVWNRRFLHCICAFLPTFLPYSLSFFE